MTFTFETLPIDNKEILRQEILTLFDRDIATVRCAFSSRNYVFIFGEGCFPCIIRVGVETTFRKTKDVLSELMWMDDLKNDVENICQPIPSLESRMVERITVEEKVYLVTMFRKANGAVLPPTKWDKNFFYHAGALLGKIHRTSSEGYQRGFRYKRKPWDENPHFDVSCFDGYYPLSARENAEALIQRIKRIPHDPRWYGMIHGDYYYANLFCDWGNLWVFDFDDCCYGYFMFDIVSMVHIMLIDRHYAAIHPAATARDRLLGEQGILTQIRAGYSSEYQLPEEQWNLFDDFFRLRIVNVLSIPVLCTEALQVRDLFIKCNQPLIEYLKEDKPPIDRLEEVETLSSNALTPEQIKIVVSMLD